MAARKSATKDPNAISEQEVLEGAKQGIDETTGTTEEPVKEEPQPEINDAPETPENGTDGATNEPAPEEAKKSNGGAKKDDGISTKTVAIEELPDNVRKVLALYPNEEELYVSRFGGVFYKNTNPKLVGNAILYKNPFYNKS